jgi:exopolyphosphatase/guanosine-5'-triphosphate,3'-diphosphate pyrophosphatase
MGLNSEKSGWKAVADLGTNTFQLLVARFENGQLKIGLRKKIGVKIGGGGMAKREILPDALVRSIDALNCFSEDLNQFELVPTDCIPLGTSAFRNALNRNEIIGIIKKETGFSVQIIPGEQEAQLIFKGVLASGAIVKNEPNLIVDIGGGSVEFIICNGSSQKWKKSFEIGGLRLLEKFQKQDRISSSEIRDLNQFVELELDELWKNLKIWKPKVLVGCSGSFDTLIEMAFAERGTPLSDVEAFPNYSIELPQLKNLKSKLVSSTLKERLEMQGMIPLRAEMIVVAVLLIELLIEKMSDPGIRTSTFALKEGYFYSNYFDGN